MVTLPKKIIHLLREFESVFSERIWEWVKVLLVGAILATRRADSGSDPTSDGIAQ